MSARRGDQAVFSRTKPIILLTGLVMVGLGIAILINPISAVETLVRIMGWVMVAYGVVTVVAAFAKGDPVHKSPSELVLGVVAIAPGLIMAAFPGPLIKFAWTILGILVVITGVLDVIEAGDFRRAGSPLAVPATISGIITALLGVVAVVSPMFPAGLGMVFAALALVVGGISEIIFGLGA